MILIVFEGELAFQADEMSFEQNSSGRVIGRLQNGGSAQPCSVARVTADN